MKKFMIGLYFVLSIAISTNGVFAVDLSPAEKENLSMLKNQVFGGLSFQNADKIAAGELEPLLNFTVKDSLFVNWSIPPAHVPALETALALPDNFKLTPLAIIRGEQPRHYLSLNIYQATIGQPGFRAEWSVYVTEGDNPTPHFMVIEAQSSVDTFDPVFGPVSGVDFTYRRDGGGVSANIVSDTMQFSLSFREPTLFYWRQLASDAWVKANDLIYWRNGIADKAYYNGSLIKQKMKMINPFWVKINDQSQWAQYLSPWPKHVFVYDRELEFAVTPWANLKDPAAKIRPEIRQQLSEVKPEAFSALARVDASQIIQGQKEALLDFNVANGNNAYFINFRVPFHRVRALSNFLNLPKGVYLAPINTFVGQWPMFMISLNVYQGSGVVAGTRAEWSVYVTSDDSPFQAYFMVIEALSNVPSLDPVNLFTEPAELLHYQVDESGWAETQIRNGDQNFSANFILDKAQLSQHKLSRPWVFANDRVYWLNGVYDRLSYSGLLTDAKIIDIDLSSLTIDNQTAWAAFVEPEPITAFAFLKPLEYKIMPWFNVEELPVH